MIKTPSSFKKDQLMFENWRQFLESDQVEPTVWLQMVRENYEAILAEDPLNEDLMEESVWSKIKYYVGKMGSLEKGGKMLGRGKRTAAALDKLEAAIEAAAKKGFGDFRKQLEADYPEFPNMEKKEDFVNALLDIGAVYDSIDAAVAKYDDQGAQVKGGLDPDSANAMVSALREYVAFLLDYKLADSYKHFTEDKDRIDEAPPPVGGVAQVGGGERRTPATSSIAGGGGAPEDPDAPKGKYTKRGADGDAVDSETIKGLESNVLPILLALTGLAGVLIGLLLKTPWALEMFKSIRGLKESGSVTETVKDTVKVFTKIKKVLAPQAGEGFTQMFGRIAAGDPTTFGPQTTPGELFGVMQKMGVDPQNPTQLFELGVDPQAYAEAIQGNAGTLGEMFPASNQSLWLDKGTEAIAEAQKETTATITRSVTKTVGGGGAAVAAGQLAAASTLATTLGIGLIASGAAVKLLRMKGLKSSRAQMFQDLSKELQPFQGGKIDPEPDPCEKVVAELTEKFKTGMLVRYMEEKGRGNITGMSPGEGAGGETLITKIIAMPGEGDIPSIEEQQETDAWKKEKVIFVGVQGMVPLEAGSRRAVMNKFRAAAIRDCVLNIQVPTEEEMSMAFASDQRMAKRMGIDKPEDGAADLGDKQKRMVDLKRLDRTIQSLNNKLPDGVEPLSPAQLRAAKVLLARISKEAGGAQRFTMQEEEGEEKSTFVPLKKLVRALVNDLKYPPQTDDPEADDVHDKEAFSAKPGSPGAIRLANFIRAASSAKVGVMFSYDNKPVKGALKKKIIKHLTTPKEQKLKESVKKGWKLLSDGKIRRVNNEKK
jgi:hypothetical protein